MSNEELIIQELAHVKAEISQQKADLNQHKESFQRLADKIESKFDAHNVCLTKIQIDLAKFLEKMESQLKPGEALCCQKYSTNLDQLRNEVEILKQAKRTYYTVLLIAVGLSMVIVTEFPSIVKFLVGFSVKVAGLL